MRSTAPCASGLGSERTRAIRTTGRWDQFPRSQPAAAIRRLGPDAAETHRLHERRIRRERRRGGVPLPAPQDQETARDDRVPHRIDARLGGGEEGPWDRELGGGRPLRAGRDRTRLVGPSERPGPGAGSPRRPGTRRGCALHGRGRLHASGRRLSGTRCEWDLHQLSSRRDERLRGRLHDRLRAEFGDDRVFMDLRRHRSGGRISSSAIETAIGESDALLLVIGPGLGGGQGCEREVEARRARRTSFGGRCSERSSTRR